MPVTEEEMEGYMFYGRMIPRPQKKPNLIRRIFRRKRKTPLN